jgi:hypothetical protein
MSIRRDIYNLALHDDGNPYSTDGSRNLWIIGYRREEFPGNINQYGSYNWRCWYRGLMFRLIYEKTGE